MASKKARGKRAKTRDKFSRRGSKVTVNKLLQDFEENSRVIIKTNSSIHEGIPFRRFHGKIGTVIGKQGRAFKVEFKDGNLSKQLIVGAAHLMPVPQQKIAQ